MLAFLLCARHAVIVNLPRHAVSELSFADFDRLYLDKRPVILTGATICPDNVTLDNVGDSCSHEKRHGWQVGGRAPAGLGWAKRSR